MKKFKTTAAIAATAMMLSICMCGCGMDETSKDNATTSEQTQMTTENNNATGGNATNSNGVGNGIKDAADGVGEGVKEEMIERICSRLELPKVSEMVSRMLWTAWKMP